MMPSALTANHAPFNDERKSDAHQDETPQRILIDVPESRLHQESHDRRNQKQRSGEPAVQRAVATKVDETGQPERPEQQRVGIRFDCGPRGSASRPNPYSTTNAAAQNHMAPGLVQQV